MKSGSFTTLKKKEPICKKGDLKCHLVLEREEEKNARAGQEVFAAAENLDGLGLAGPQGLRKLVFAVIAGQLFLTDRDNLVFKQYALIAASL